MPAAVQTSPKVYIANVQGGWCRKKSSGILPLRCRRVSFEASRWVVQFGTDLFDLTPPISRQKMKMGSRDAMESIKGRFRRLASVPRPTFSIPENYTSLLLHPEEQHLSLSDPAHHLLSHHRTRNDTALALITAPAETV